MCIIRMLSILFTILALGTSSLFTQEPKIYCPQNSLLGEDITLFIVTIRPGELYRHIGDFYSDSWQKILLPQNTFTFTPPTRTTNFRDITLHELLLYNSSSQTTDTFTLRWELLSDTFNPTGQFDIVYYQQAISVVPVCSGGLLSSVTWKTRACISGDLGIAMKWFGKLHEEAAGNVFKGIAQGWMGGQETGVGNCYGLNSSTVVNSTMSDSDGSNSGDGGNNYSPVPELQSSAVRRWDIECIIVIGIILVGGFAVL